MRSAKPNSWNGNIGEKSANVKITVCVRALWRDKRRRENDWSEWFALVSVPPPSALAVYVPIRAQSAIATLFAVEKVAEAERTERLLSLKSAHQQLWTQSPLARNESKFWVCPWLIVNARISPPAFAAFQFSFSLPSSWFSCQSLHLSPTTRFPSIFQSIASCGRAEVKQKYQFRCTQFSRRLAT